MQYSTDTELLEIIELNEADCVEFKESLSGSAPEKIREAICAFANDLPNYEKPGFVFIGVKKDRTIVGLSVTDQLPISDVSDLNLIQFEHEYLPQAFAPDILDANERTLKEQLAVTKMIASVDEPVATVMGILVLGKNPQDFLPGAYVQFLKIDGKDLSDEILDNEAIGGSIPDQIRRLDDKLRAHNRIAVDITSGPLEKRTALYPIEAVQQITRNAIMHRTYEATNARFMCIGIRTVLKS